MSEENFGGVPTKTRKEERREADKAKENARVIRQAVVWGITVLVIIGATAGIVFMVKNGGTSNGGGGTAGEITSSDWVKGNENATTTLVEYSDFQCPACAAYYPIVKKVVEEDFKGKIKFAYRHFPLLEIHKNGQLSVVAAEAAGLQGKFWEMHDKLFETQETWSNNPKVKEIFIGYAKDMGLDVENFTNDLESKELNDKAIAAYKNAVRMGLNSTPTFFINGKKITNPQGYEAFKDAINNAIKGNS